MMVNFIERAISNLKKEDLKIAVSGVIIDKGKSSFMIDDGTGRAGVFFEGDILNGKYIRVFGRLVNFENKEIEAEFIQDLDKIDKRLHKKLLEMLAE